MFCVDIDFSPSFSVTRPRVDLMTTSARAFTTRHLTNILRNVYAFLSLGRLYHSVHGAFGSPSFRGTAGDHKGLCWEIVKPSVNLGSPAMFPSMIFEFPNRVIKAHPTTPHRPRPYGKGISPGRMESRAFLALPLCASTRYNERRNYPSHSTKE